MEKALLQILPSNIVNCLALLPSSITDTIEEIRIREGKPLELIYGGKIGFVTSSGELTLQREKGYSPTAEDSQKILQRLSNYSLYTLEEELRRGYITIQGGHRVGIAGRAILEQGRIRLLRDIASFNIRLARQVQGSANSILPFLIDKAQQTIHHTLIIAPPQCGKTTLLRDLARQLSNGLAFQPLGFKVGIVDERSELACCHRGVPQVDVGQRTDVLDACPKVEGMMMMIRSMSPDILVVDEIGKPEDSDAINEALNSGVKVLTTAHGADLEEVSKRPSIRRLIQERVFDRYVVLSRKKGAGTVDGIYDGALQPLSLTGKVTVC